MIDKCYSLVSEILGSDKSGHGMDHIDRVVSLSKKMAELENADVKVCILIALLHDVDDYKLFGKDQAEELSNVKAILDKLKVSDDIKDKALSQIKKIGYSKRLNGVVPDLLEGMIVSDADMLDVLGASGIIRTLEYGYNINRPFFVKDSFPRDNITYEDYTSKVEDASIHHFFDKILKIKKYMLTDTGMKICAKRHDFVVDFLYQFFDENDASDWKKYLDNYLKDNY